MYLTSSKKNTKVFFGIRLLTRRSFLNSENLFKQHRTYKTFYVIRTLSKL